MTPVVPWRTYFASKGSLQMQAFWARIPLATRLILDVGMLVAMILLIDPRGSGIAVHEWVGIVIAPFLIFHLMLNWPWTVQVTRKLVR